MSVSNRLRYEVLRRDNFTCRYCGASAPDVVLEVDHVVPVSLGGTDHPRNLVAACVDCNSGKSSSSPDDTHVADADASDVRWAQAMREAAAQMQSEERIWDAGVEAFHDEWTSWKRSDGSTLDLPEDWRSRIRHMLRAGLPAPIMVELVVTAMSNKKVYDEWAYFVACCMKRIDAIQERASEIMRGDPL